MKDTPANLTVVDNQLLLHPNPRQGENLAGYLLRLANLNCLQHPQELLEYLGQKSISRYQPSLSPQLGIYSLEKLALQLNQPVEVLDSLAWPFDVRVGKHRKFQYKGGAWPQELLRYSYRAWCPCCLAESAMHLAAWDWQLTTYCSKHQVLLVDTCPACQRRVSWRYALLHHCSCGFPLQNALTTRVHTFSPTIDISTLSAIEIQRFITLALLQQENSPGKLEVTAFAKMTIGQLHAMIANISLDQLQQKETFHAALLSCLDRRHTWQPTLGPRFATAPLLQGLQIDVAFDQDLARVCADWTTNQAPAASSSLDTVHEPELALPIDTVAIILNASSHVVRRLIKTGLLSEVYDAGHPKRPGHRVAFVGSTSLQQLQALLRQKTTIQENTRLVRFDHFGIDFATRLNLLSGLQEGKAEVSAYDPCIGLPSLELSLHSGPATISNQLSVKDAAKILDIYTDAVYRIAKAGLLRYQPHLTRQLRIEVNDLHAFQQEFIFVRELAQRLACNATNLADKLMSAGLKAVHGPVIDGGLVYVFRRKEVEALDLVTIAMHSPYQSRCGRGHKRFPICQESSQLTSSAACQFLGIKPRHLDTLCHLGFLTPEHTTGEYDQQIFDAAQLENYLASYRNNPDLILLTAAKESLHQEGTRFWNDLIQLGLITPISDGLADYCQKDQLRDAVIFRKSILSTAELSSMTGVKKARLRWESKYGCLVGMITHVGSSQLRFYFLWRAVEKLKWALSHAN